MFNVDSIMPYVAGLLVADFVAIPINIGLSLGMDDVSPKDDLPKNLVVICYMLGVIVMIVAANLNSLPLFGIMCIVALAIWPLTIWRFCVAPRRRPRRR